MILLAVISNVCFNILHRLSRRLTKELKELILKMFDPDEEDRPTFKEVLNHAWVLIDDNY